MMQIAMKLREGMIAKFPEIIRQKLDNRDIYVVEIFGPDGYSVDDLPIPMYAIAENEGLSSVIISGQGSSSKLNDYGYGNFMKSMSLPLDMFYKFWISFIGDIDDDDLSILSNDTAWQVEEVYLK